ncbi:MAG: DUF1772 domain-containing protein [Neomegalonema sp.]|nr:DUF1772 domain-containing protein [Neomegalonema sp.]
MPIWFALLCQFSLIAFALLGGVFLAFSDFIMRSLSQMRASGGVEAMQIINREVFRYVFIPLFMIMAPVSLLIAGYAYAALPGAAAMLLIAAALVYVFGCFGVTVFLNVPLNEALAKMDTDGGAALEFWRATYLPRWTLWNSVRTAACLLASALCLAGVLASDLVKTH